MRWCVPSTRTDWECPPHADIRTGAYGNPANAFTIGTIGNDASGAAFATARPGSSFTTSNLADGVYINYVIPEPSSALLGGLASLLLLRRRR